MSHKQPDWEATLQPMLNITEINRKAFEKVAELHTHCINDLMEANTKQFQMIMGNPDPKTTSELQFNYFKTVEARLTQTAEDELKALEEARTAIGEVVEKSVEHHSHFISELYPQPLKA